MTRIYNLIVCLCACCYLASCVSYKRYQLPVSKITRIDNPKLNYYLLDAAHPNSRVWQMSDARVGQDNIDCFLTKMTEEDALEVSFVRGRRDALWRKDDVLFYADSDFAASLQDTATQTILLQNLEKIEVYEVNQVKTFGMPLLTFCGLILILYAISG